MILLLVKNFWGEGGVLQNGYKMSHIWIFISIEGRKQKKIQNIKIQLDMSHNKMLENNYYTNI